MAATDAPPVRVEDYRLPGLTDAQVIEAALQAATALGVRNVVFGPRTYELDHAIRPPSHVSLVGDGATITYTAKGPPFSFFLLAGVEDVGVSGFAFRGRGRTEPGDGPDVHAVNVLQSRGVTIADNAFNGVKAIHLNGATDVAVTGNLIRGGPEGVVIGRLSGSLPSFMSSNIVIRGNDIEGQTREAIDLNSDARDVVIAGNRLAGGSRAAGNETADELLDIGGGAMANITVTGNLFDGLGRNARALSAKVMVDGLVISDNTFQNLFAVPFGAAMSLGDRITYSITGNMILSGQDGIRIGAGPAGVLADNSFGEAVVRDLVLRHAQGLYIVAGGQGAEDLAATFASAQAKGAGGAAVGRLIDPGGTHDTVIGGLGADTLRGGDGNDRLEGAEGADSLAGGNGADRLLGGGGNDLLDGSRGANTLEGGAGDDTLRGGIEADRLAGDAGDDSVSGFSGNDRIEGGEGADTITGEVGADTLLGGAGADSLSGGSAGDLLDGGDAADTLLGGLGADRLIGGAGDDVLVGGAAADLMWGGAGRDLFVLGAGGGADRIGDFESGLDRLSVPRGLLAAPQDPLASLVATKAGLLLHLLDGGSVLLQGVHAIAPGDILIA